MEQIKRIYLYPSGGPGGPNKFTLGTFEDLKANGITPAPGLRLKFYADDADSAGNRDDLWFEGIVDFDPKRGWYAVIDGEIVSESEVKLREQNNDGNKT